MFTLAELKLLWDDEALTRQLCLHSCSNNIALIQIHKNVTSQLVIHTIPHTRQLRFVHTFGIST